MFDIEEFRRKLRRVERYIFNVTKNESTCCGVTTAQCHALLELSFLQEASIKELASALGSDKGNLSRTIDSLVEKGFVLRESNSEDRRALKVRLTEQGSQKVAYINELCNSYYACILAQIPESKHESIVEAFSLLSDAIKSAEEQGLSLCSLQKEGDKR